MELAIKKTNLLKRDLKRRLSTIQTGIQTAIGAAWDAGELLSELKGRIKHGEWLPYLKTLELSERQAQKYIKLYNDYERDAALEYKSINMALEDKSVKKQAEIKDKKNYNDQKDIEDDMSDDEKGNTNSKADLEYETIAISRGDKERLKVIINFVKKEVGEGKHLYAESCKIEKSLEL